MDIFVNYAKIHLLLSQFESRKKVVLLYNVTHKIEKKKFSSDFLEVAKFVASTDSPEKKLMQDLNHFWEIICLIIEPLFFTLSLGFNSDDIRKKGLLSITLKENLLPYPIKDPSYYFLQDFQRLIEWTVYGIAFCPQTFYKDIMVQIAELALTNLYVIPVYREIVFYPHEPMETMLGSSLFKKMKISKKRKVISNALNNCLANAYDNQEKYRLFLVKEISTLFHLLKSRPGLIPQKINIAFASLGLSYYQILWYLNHFNKLSSKSKAKSSNEFQYGTFVQLIYFVAKLSQLILKYHSIVRKYYIINMHKNDFATLEEFYQKFFLNSKTLSHQIIESNINILKTTSPEQNEQDFDLSEIFLNWFRCEAELSEKGLEEQELQISKLSNFPKILMKHLDNLKIIGILEERLDSICGLFHLFPYLNDLLLIYRESITNLQFNQQYVSSFIDIVLKSNKICHAFFPEESIKIGEISVHFVERFLVLISSRISGLVRTIGGAKKGFSFLSEQLRPIIVAKHLINTQKAEQKGHGYNITIPGAESLYMDRSKIQELYDWKLQLHQLCSAIEDFPHFIIYDTQFMPSKFIEEALELAIKTHFMKYIYTETEPKFIQRPSIFLNRISSLVYSLKLVQDNLKIDVMKIARSVLLSQVYANSPGPQGQLLSWENPPDIHGTILSSYVEFFENFISNYILKGVVYSELSRCFASRHGMPFRADFYFETSEMIALCDFLGPYGVMALDNTCLDIITKLIITVKEILVQNETLLIEYEKCYWKPEKTSELLKKFVEIDHLITVSIHIGAILKLREMLYDGLEKSIQNNSSLIYENVSIAFKQYLQNPFGKEELLDMDCLAQSIGISRKRRVDHAFTAAIQTRRKKVSLGGMWESIPYLYAAGFTSSIWTESKYIPDIEGHSNNSHCIVQCIQKMLEFQFILSEERDFVFQEGERLLSNYHHKFIEVSSFVLFQIPNISDKKFPIGSMFMILDKFANSSPFISREFLEEFAPYILLTTFYGQYIRQFEKDELDIIKTDQIDEPSQNTNEIEKPIDENEQNNSHIENDN
eukprot:Anaeramoba_ignava/a609167_68.p1 GENE.a609167_68~~a609167_68.p1  ORF type:complete len:1053 (+),score=319.08 a609167_68:397-3555(+)